MSAFELSSAVLCKFVVTPGLYVATVRQSPDDGGREDGVTQTVTQISVDRSTMAANFSRSLVVLACVACATAAVTKEQSDLSPSALTDPVSFRQGSLRAAAQAGTSQQWSVVIRTKTGKWFFPRKLTIVDDRTFTLDKRDAEVDPNGDDAPPEPKLQGTFARECPVRGRRLSLFDPGAPAAHPSFPCRG